MEVMKRFTTSTLTERSMILEVFTDSNKENEGIYAMNHIVSDLTSRAQETTKDIIKFKTDGV